MSRIDFRYNLIKAHSWASRVSGIHRWILKRLKSTNLVFVLAYHWVSFDRLKSHLSFLHRLFDFCSLDEISKTMLGGPLLRPRIAVTFDDGLGDVIEDAVTVAYRYHIPMTFFLPIDFIDKKRPYWFMELPSLIKAAMGHSIEYNGETFPLRSKDDVDRTYRTVFEKIMSQRPKPAEIENSMEKIRSRLPSSVIEAAYENIPKPIGWQRVRELSKDKLLSFGSHTVSHPFLSSLSEDEICHELLTSRQKIQDVTGKPVQYFCYPYGARNDIGQIAPAIARRIYDMSTTMIRGAVKPDTDRAYMARVPIYERDSPEMVLNKVCYVARKALKLEYKAPSHFIKVT